MEHQGQSDAGASAHHQSHHAHDHGIAEQSPYIRIAEKTDKMLQPYPFTPQNPLRRIVISECDRSPVHGIIAENKIIGDNRQDKEIQPPSSSSDLSSRAWLFALCSILESFIFARKRVINLLINHLLRYLHFLMNKERERLPPFCHRNPFYLISGFLYKPTG